ncbi:MAG: 4-hydroxythreonine-4-phosphate dehydrogenase PdxA [Candidatus Omnitrophota bacterium]
MGDPSGIGPEIIFRALPQIRNLAQFTIIGDKWVFGQTTDRRPQTVDHRLQATDWKFVDIRNIDHKKFKFGQVRAEYGKASIEYLDKALELLKNKEIDCLVTCPVSKEAVNLSGLKFSGHTEYLANKTRTKDFVMMLLNNKLKFSLITQHIPIYKVSSEINTNKLKKALELTYQGLKKLFGIKNPKIVVCGLNPHASDNGIIGDEEGKIIAPIIKKLNYCHGPIPADIAIAQAYEGKFDAVLAMYHDQALIPLKLTSKETGVNLTLGLAFVRTSPLHGTAFDIAGKNIACPNSFISAVKLAVQCAQNR